MIVFKDISKKYQSNFIFNNLNLKLENTGIYFLVAPSGCGKTTLLNLISGFDLKYDGNIFINNKKLSKQFSIDNYFLKTSYIGKEDFLFYNLSLKENLSIAINSSNFKGEIDELLNSFNLLKQKNVKVKYLSEGEKKRLSFIRDIILDRKIILLDEPTASLNEKDSNNLISNLRKLSKTKLIIIATHNLEYITKKDKVLEIREKDIIITNQKTIKKEKEIDIEIKKTKKNKYVFLKFLKTFLIKNISLMFLISSLLITLFSFQKILNGLVSDVKSQVGEIYKYKQIRNKPTNYKLDSNNFVILLKEINPYINNYYYQALDEKMFDIELFLNQIYFENGFSINSKTNLEKTLEKDEVILFLNESNIENFFPQKEISIEETIESIKEEEIKLKYHNQKEVYKIKDIYLSSINEIVFSNKFQVTNYISKPEIERFFVEIKQNKTIEFIDFINQTNYLGCELIDKENNIYFIYSLLIPLFTRKELEELKINYIALTNQGIGLSEDFSQATFKTLKSLSYLDNEVKGSKIEFLVTEENLLINEIIISNSLLQNLKVKIGEEIFLNFIDKKIKIKIKDVINSNRNIIYHNSKWSYEFFENNFNNFDSRIDTLLVLKEENNVPIKYQIIDMFEELNNSINKMFINLNKTTTIFLYIYLVFIVLIVIYFLFDLLKEKKNFIKKMFYIGISPIKGEKFILIESMIYIFLSFLFLIVTLKYLVVIFSKNFSNIFFSFSDYFNISIYLVLFYLLIHILNLINLYKTRKL